MRFQSCEELQEYLVRRSMRTEDGCWDWIGATVRDHGKMHIGQRRELAHRVAYRAFVGPIPSGRHIHHQCRNPRCINPAHLVALTAREHRHEHMPAQCKHGHLFDAANTYIEPATGARSCRACGREAARRYQARKRTEGRR